MLYFLLANLFCALLGYIFELLFRVGSLTVYGLPDWRPILKRSMEYRYRWAANMAGALLSLALGVYWHSAQIPNTQLIAEHPLRVLQVLPESYAEEINIQPNDLIVGFGATPSPTTFELFEETRRNAGKLTVLRVRRGDKLETYQVPLNDPPSRFGMELQARPITDEDRLRFVVDTLIYRLRAVYFEIENQPLNRKTLIGILEALAWEIYLGDISFDLIFAGILQGTLWIAQGIVVVAVNSLMASMRILLSLYSASKGKNS